MIKLPELIFNTSRKGKTGISVSLNKFSDDLISIDNSKLRKEIEDFLLFPKWKLSDIFQTFQD